MKQFEAVSGIRNTEVDSLSFSLSVFHPRFSQTFSTVAVLSSIPYEITKPALPLFRFFASDFSPPLL